METTTRSRRQTASGGGRSRKGCAQCRKRKIKCDETQPQCGQCQRSKKSCSIVDGVFRQHPYTISARDHTTAASEQSSISRGNGKRVSFETRVAFEGDLEGDPSSRRPAGETPSPNDGLPIENPAVAQPSIQPENSGMDVQEDSWAREQARLKLEAEESSFLLRHFAEGIGQSLDPVTPDRYFSRRILQLARDNDLIKYAACAAAAKQLGHLIKRASQSRKSHYPAVFTWRTEGGVPDFLWYGAKYYEKAIQAMAAELSLNPSNALAESPSQFWDASPASAASGQSSSNEICLVAVCIMCVYEELSGSTRAWSRHLRGSERLLRLDLHVRNPESAVQSPLGISQPSQTMRSVFWSYVQNTLKIAFFRSHDILIDTENLWLWREMGLPLNDQGNLDLSSPYRDASLDIDIIMLYAVMRLACKILKFAGYYSQTLEEGFDHEDRTVRWTSLELDFMRIRMCKPGFDRPDFRKESSDDFSSCSTAFASEVWFSNSACALSSIYREAAEVLLLIHKPSENEFVADRLRAHSKLLEEMGDNAQRLIGIALGQPEPAVKMHLTQPLYLVGRGLTWQSDRSALVATFDEIERTTGISIGGFVRALAKEWGSDIHVTTTELEGQLSDLAESD